MVKSIQYLKDRLCKKCNIVKKYFDYRKIKNSLGRGSRKGTMMGWTSIIKDHRFYMCKSCENFSMKKRYNNNPIPQILYNARIRAKEESIPFKIDSSYLTEIFPKDNICPVLKIKFKFGDKNKDNKKNYVPTLHRIVQSKGYVKGNCIIISYIVSKIIKEITPDQIKKILKYFKNI
jgi:hypothetical protein